MAFELPSLPYSPDALEPYISAKTLDFHHGKHHAAYVSKLNDLVKGGPWQDKTIEQIIQGTATDASQAGIFNNAAQAWNHAFFWKCLRPKGGGTPPPAVLQKIQGAFGSLDKLKEELKNAAIGQFGSGWAWLVLDRGQLKVTKTANAQTPMLQDQKPLLTIDVWEHAYYLDYQNRRPDFVQAVLDHLVSWDFVEQNLR